LFFSEELEHAIGNGKAADNIKGSGYDRYPA
jgi:hypothetical protein